MMPLKNLFDAWSRFPSHTRTERNGAAGDADNIIARDFYAPHHADTPQPESIKDEQSQTWNRLPQIMQKTLKKGKSKSLTLRGPNSYTAADRARRNRKGFLGKWKRLYRSSSSDLRKYALFHGHRSSVSVGDALEYLELECLPGEAMFAEAHIHRLQTTLINQLSDEAAERKARKRLSCPESTNSGRGRLPRTQAIDWGKFHGYGDCVGSLSALTSKSRLASNCNLDNVSVRSEKQSLDFRSPELRDSTLDFQQGLNQDQEAIKVQLFEKLNGFAEDKDGEIQHGVADQEDDGKRLSSVAKSTTMDTGGSSIKTKDLKIPGSFG